MKRLQTMLIVEGSSRNYTINVALKMSLSLIGLFSVIVLINLPLPRMKMRRNQNQWKIKLLLLRIRWKKMLRARYLGKRRRKIKLKWMMNEILKRMRIYCKGFSRTLKEIALKVDWLEKRNQRRERRTSQRKIRNAWYFDHVIQLCYKN